MHMAAIFVMCSDRNLTCMHGLNAIMEEVIISQEIL